MNCPSCAAAVSPDALKCGACGELLRDYKECPECFERVRLNAARCRYCGFGFPAAPDITAQGELQRVLSGDLEAGSPADAEASEIDFTIGATSLGGFVCHHSLTALFRPPEMRVTDQEINLKSWSMLGLRSVEQKIPTSRITSVRLVLGVQWGAIVIETFGGGTADFEICGLDKQEARDMVTILEQHVLRNVPVQRLDSTPASPRTA